MEALLQPSLTEIFMLLSLTVFSWAVLAYVFRAQIPVVYAAIVADIAWVRNLFKKAPPAPAAVPLPPPSPIVMPVGFQWPVGVPVPPGIVLTPATPAPPATPPPGASA